MVNLMQNFIVMYERYKKALIKTTEKKNCSFKKFKSTKTFSYSINYEFYHLSVKYFWFCTGTIFLHDSSIN